MKTHWYIIICTILLGLGMYYYLEIRNNKVDRINILNQNQVDFAVYIGDQTDTIFYKDGQFSGENGQDFKLYQLTDGKISCTLGIKNTVIVTYQNKWFYDIPLTKTKDETGYNINIQVLDEADDSKYLDAVLKKGSKPFLMMNGYMMPMYDHFEMWIKDQQYRNIRVIEEPLIDSLNPIDSLLL